MEHGRVILLVTLQAEAWNFTKSNTPPWAFFTFFILYNSYHIVQGITVVKVFIVADQSKIF